MLLIWTLYLIKACCRLKPGFHRSIREEPKYYYSTDKKVGCAVPVSKKGCVKVVQQLAREVKKVRQKVEAEMGKLAESEDNSEELELRMQLVVDDFEKMARMHAQITARDVEVNPMRVTVSRSTKPLETIN